jgi:hypothetical protein
MSNNYNYYFESEENFRTASMMNGFNDQQLKFFFRKDCELSEMFSKIAISLTSQFKSIA